MLRVSVHCYMAETREEKLMPTTQGMTTLRWPDGPPPYCYDVSVHCYMVETREVKLPPTT